MLNEQIIREKIVTNQRWLEAAILALYALQTNDEVATSTTRHQNARGFNSADASKLSYYARWISKGRSLNGKFLLDAQRRVQKYAKQLLALAEAKAARNSVSFAA
jgi:hypothetical protein